MRREGKETVNASVSGSLPQQPAWARPRSRARTPPMFPTWMVCAQESEPSLVASQGMH